jgi:hypothetical protein
LAFSFFGGWLSQGGSGHQNLARSKRLKASSGFKRADVAQLVEHSLGKGEVTSSILVISSRNARSSSQFVVHRGGLDKRGAGLERLDDER